MNVSGYYSPTFAGIIYHLKCPAVLHTFDSDQSILPRALNHHFTAN
jgi:hypothetical protein